MRILAVGVLTTAVALAVSVGGGCSASASTPRAGSMDTSFGTHGVVHLSPASTAPAKKVDPVAHVLASAGSRLWVGADQSFGAYVVPLTATGHTVTTFLHGKPAVPVSNDEQYVGLRSVLPTGDGGALVVSLIGDPSAVQVNRIKASGAKDPTWGTHHGFTYLTPACGDCSIDITGATLLANGRVRVMGTYTDEATSTRHALVVGLTPHGRPDTSVGPAGWRIVAESPDATTQAVGADTSGRLYFVLDDAGQPDLLRTTPEGAIDPTYHTGGVCLDDAARRPHAVPEQPRCRPERDARNARGEPVRRDVRRRQHEDQHDAGAVAGGALPRQRTWLSRPGLRPGPRRVPDVRPLRRLGVHQRSAYRRQWALPAGAHLLGRHAFPAPAPADLGMGRAGRPLRTSRRRARVRRTSPRWPADPTT